jgi:hypothetical protein
MDSLPSSLLYFTSQIANFTRNTIQVNTLNQTTLASNGVKQIRVALPVNAVLNMKSLSMSGKVTTTGVGSTSSGVSADVVAFIPKGGIAALLDRVSFSAGGISLDNGPVPYHVIYAVKENLEKSNAKSMSDDRVLQEATIAPISADNPQSADHGFTKTLIQNNFLGFTEAHPAYLDMSLLPEVFMTLQCAPASVLPVQQVGKKLGETLDSGWSGSGCEYKIEDIKFTVEVCQIGSGMYDALTQRLLAERGSIDVPYPQYQVFSNTTTAGVSGGVRGSVSCMSLDRIYAVARNNNTAEGAKRGYQYQQAPIELKDGIGNAFHQRAIDFSAADTKNWQFTLNNAPMPMYRASTLDAYNFAVCAEDRTYSKDRGSQVHSQKEWFQNKWTATMRLNLDNDPRRLSGVNLSSINAQIVYDPTTGGTDGGANSSDARQMMLITKQTSILRIGQSRACAVVA